MGQLLPTLLSREASGPPSPPGLAPLSPGACLSNVPSSLCLSVSHRPCPALTGAWRPYAVRRHLLRARGLELLRLGGAAARPLGAEVVLPPGRETVAARVCSPWLAWDFLRRKRVWAQACGGRKATLLVVLVSCPRGQEVSTQAAPGTLTRQRYWQGRGWPGSPDCALAPGWPGPLRAVRELWENTAGRGGLAGSSQGVGGQPSFPPFSHTTPHFAS